MDDYVCDIREHCGVRVARREARRGHHTAGESASGLAGSGDGGSSVSADLLGSGVAEDPRLKTTSPTLYKLYFFAINEARLRNKKNYIFYDFYMIDTFDICSHVALLYQGYKYLLKFKIFIS